MPPTRRYGRYDTIHLRGGTRVRTFDLGPVLLWVLGIQLLFILATFSFAAEVPAPPALLLVSTRQSHATTVPIVVTGRDGGAPVLRTVSLKWNPSANPSDIVRIGVAGPGGRQANELFESQASLAALTAAFAWQTPWQGAAWEIADAPASDGTAVNAPLAVAMIATAGGIDYPADTVLLADLNPDGSLAPVPQTAARLAAIASARAGIRTVILPAVTPTERGADGQAVNLAGEARRLGLTPRPVNTLAEAAAVILGRSLPTAPAPAAPPRLDPALTAGLTAECRAELAALEAGRAAWPVTAAQQDALPLWQKSLWSEALAHFENGTALLRDGKVYAARGELAETSAQVAALSSLKDIVPPVAELNAQATTLAAEYQAAIAQVSDRQEELQDGLVAAEMSDWAGGIVANLQGAQNLVYQTSGRRSDALPEQKKLAQLQLAVAVRKAEAKRGRIASFIALHDALTQQDAVPIFDRAGLWLPQLLPAHLALGESFALRLQKADPALSDSLIYDPGLTAQARLLRERKGEWDNRRLVQTALAATTAAPHANAAVEQIGFTPGAAYRPVQAPAAPRPASLSQTEETLRWVNDYTEMAALYNRYFQFGGSYHPREMQWTVEDRAVLAGMLANADNAARAGIGAAREAGVDTAVLQLVYERAAALRESPLDSGRMEALRQFWRCNLLGNTAWQLASIPKAVALPMEAQAEEQTDAAKPTETELLARIKDIPDPEQPPRNPDPQPTPQPDFRRAPSNPNIDPQPIPVASLTDSAGPGEEIRRAALATN